MAKKKPAPVSSQKSPRSFPWYYEPADREALDKAAKEDGRSLNQELTTLLRIGLKVREHHRKSTTLPLDIPS